MPARRVSNRGGSITGSFPSIKMGAPVRYESTIERDLLYFLEYDQAVLHYHAQPFIISHTYDDGYTHTYTPDFQVVRVTGNEVVECKPVALLETSHVQRQLHIGQTWAAANDHHFVVITDVDLRQGHRLENLKLLWRYSRLSVPALLTLRCLAYLQLHADGAALRDISTYIAGDTDSFRYMPFLYTLLFQQVLLADLNQSLTPTIWVKCATPIH